MPSCQEKSAESKRRVVSGVTGKMASFYHTSGTAQSILDQALYREVRHGYVRYTGKLHLFDRCSVGSFTYGHDGPNGHRTLETVRHPPVNYQYVAWRVRRMLVNTMPNKFTRRGSHTSTSVPRNHILSLQHMPTVPVVGVGNGGCTLFGLRGYRYRQHSSLRTTGPVPADSRRA